MTTAGERSAVYRVLAESFSYAGAQAGAFRISGADYNHAFEPAINPTACSLQESAHTEQDHSALFEELMRFYGFFGLSRGDGAEMPDHLSVELEFMHFLTHLESDMANEPEELESVRRAQKDFLIRHVSRLARSVHDNLKSMDPRCKQLVTTCHEFIEAELSLVEAECYE